MTATAATEITCKVMNCTATTRRPAGAGWLAFADDSDDATPGAVFYWCRRCYHTASISVLRGMRQVSLNPLPPGPGKPRQRANTVELPTSGPYAACLACGSTEDVAGMDTVVVQQLLTVGGRSMSVYGRRCSECRRGLDYRADMDYLVLAAIKRDCNLEDLPRHPLWAVYYAESQAKGLPAPPPEEPWGF